MHTPVTACLDIALTTRRREEEEEEENASVFKMLLLLEFLTEFDDLLTQWSPMLFV